MSRADRVACEDVVMFVNAAIASTAQREFRSDAAAQRLSLGFLHEYVLGNYRDLYAATLALDVNDRNAALVVTNLLRTAREASAAQRTVEGRLIAARLRSLPPQRVYGVLRELRRLRINNRRTRAVVRDWVAARPDPAFDAIKYRRSLSVAARHNHLPLPGEVGTVLFDWRRPKRYETPMLEAWRRAHYEQRALYELPYTVAEGELAAGTRRPPAVRRPAAERVSPAVRQLVATLGDVPVVVLGRRADVLAWNTAGHALFAGHLNPEIPQRSNPHPNMARLVFLDAHTRDLYADWPTKARAVVATLRMASGQHPDDPLMAALVGELTVRSPEFATMWADHRVKVGGDTVYQMRHPLVGAMDVTQQTLRTDDDQTVVIATTEPGSASHAAMTLLVHGAVTTRAGAAQPLARRE
ncbi:hypothetical protein ACGFIE_26015 [Micromonospora sp. NPDC049275]|uniref:MmyB family transcriptional regulator n=1 Tax=Micromonospora sp. NPDC049275 TaxID=3364268 RepID=UPI00371D9E92